MKVRYFWAGRWRDCCLAMLCKISVHTFIRDVCPDYPLLVDHPSFVRVDETSLSFQVATLLPELTLVQVPHELVVNRIVRELWLEQLKTGRKNILCSGLASANWSEGKWRNPALEWVLAAEHGKKVHGMLGTVLFRLLLTKTCWFAPDRENRYSFQICGEPFNKPKDSQLHKSTLVVGRFSMLYCANRMPKLREWLDRPPDLCRIIFGIESKSRHLKPRYKALLPAIRDLIANHVVHPTPVGHMGGCRPPSAHVARLLWDWVKKLIPEELYGNDLRHNSRLVRRLIRLLVCDPIVPRAKRNIDVVAWSHRWFISRDDKVWTRDMAAKWLCFLLRQVCIPWLKRQYYITEQSHGRELFYYDRLDWIEKHPELPERLGMERVWLPTLVNVPRMRLIPKNASGLDVRPIAGPSDFLTDVRKAHAILKRILPLGASFFNLSKARAVIEQTEWQFAVKMDVEFAYDNVDQNKLWGYVNGALRGLSGPFTVRYYNVNNKTVLDPQTFPRQSIVSDRCTSWTLTKAELLKVVENYIFQHHVTYFGKAYRQTKGIWQGSVLSPLMCSFYMSCIMDDAYNKPYRIGTLLRYSDDHLFLANSKEAIRDFLCENEVLLPWKHDKTIVWERGQRQNVWCGIKM